MSVAAGAKTALRIASIISSATDSDEKTLQRVLTMITAALGGLMLLIAAVIAILTSPIQFIGAIGDFQEAYTYILTDTGGVNGGSPGAIIKKPSNTSPIIGTEYQKYVDSISDPNRKAIIETGFSLLEKVGYFWGGKSAAGWNDDWGKQRMVTSPGSRTTGTYRPYGLDCSGYVDWVYKTAGIGDMLSKGGTGWQWGQSYAITADELQPGDLVFKNKGSASDNHVGIYLGTDVNGNKLYLHCASSSGVVLNSYSGFKYYRRVSALDE